MYVFLQNLSTMNIVDLFFNRTLFLRFSLVTPPPPRVSFHVGRSPTKF